MKLTYFPARGVCDRIRLLLAEADIPYLEVNIPGKEFPLIKGDIPFSKLPILDDGDVRLVGAHCIMRYIALKSSLYGSNIAEKGYIDMWYDLCDEIQNGIWNADYSVQDHPTDAMKDHLTNYLIVELTSLSKEMAKHQSVYLVGNQVSMADIMLYSLLDSINSAFPILLPSFPLLSAFHDTIQSRPKIKALSESGNRW